MVQPAQQTEPTGQAVIHRREAIKRAALLAGVAFAPGWLALAERRPDVAQTPALAPVSAKYLSPTQFAVMSAMADRILPRTDTPGAADVGVPGFIDLLYGEFMTDAERTMLIGGLDAVARIAAGTGTPFVARSAEQQDDLMRTIARAEETQGSGPFRLIRSAVILGYFTSEPVGRNVLHYDPVPGRYDSCVPIEEVGNRNWNS